MKIKSFVIPAVAMLIAVTVMPAKAAGGPASSFAFGHPGAARDVNRVIAIRADDVFMDPKMITVKAGETVKFIVTNTGKLPHEFVLGDKVEQAQHEKEMQTMRDMSMQNMNMKNMDMKNMDMKNMGSMPMQSMIDNDTNGIMLKPGETRALIWIFTRSGAIEYACHEPGHYPAGMVGTITVEPASNK